MYINKRYIENIRQAIGNFNFDSVNLSDAAIEKAAPEERGELYLIRAELRALICDRAVLTDCQKAKELLPPGSVYPSAFMTMHYCNSNVIINFPTEPGAMREFSDALDASKDILCGFLGEDGAFLHAMLTSEIMYYNCRYKDSFELLSPFARKMEQRGDSRHLLMAECTLIRNTLALGEVEKTKNYVSGMMECSENSSTEKSICRLLGTWLDATTGRGGDSPRYYSVADGTVPVLTDRASAVMNGVAALSPYEDALISMPWRTKQPRMSLRGIFMMIYDAILAASKAPADDFYAEMQNIIGYVSGSNMDMCLIEYGMQILPFLEKAYAGGIGEDKWMKRIMRGAAEYENTIRRYRGE